MWKTLSRVVDDLLRGRFTRREDLAAGRIAVPTRHLIVAGLVLGMIYGAFMGLYSILKPGAGAGGAPQLVATTIKVPLLFVLTLLVTFPSLYVVGALFDSRLAFRETLRLLLGTVCVTLALLASFGPVTAFFTLSTDSYPFMVLLNVTFFAIAGMTGLVFLRRALDSVFAPNEPPGPPPAMTSDPDLPESERTRVAIEFQRRERERRATVPAPRRIFRIWVVIYAVVGAQMGWILRPFIGNPEVPFTLFRSRQSNFFEAVLHAIESLLK